MTKPLVFMMGLSPAFLPTDRRYARNHMWAEAAEGRFRVGFSAYAVRLLGDVAHLEWSVEAGMNVAAGQEIGFIEGSKATSDLYAPMAGQIEQLNRDVPADPTLINSHPYEAGWLLSIDGPGDGLLSPEEYLALLEAAWPLAQRILKRQVGANNGR